MAKSAVDTRTKEWRAVYQRLRVARTKLSHVRTHNELGRDIQTGMRYAEVERLAELKLALRDAEYAAFMQKDPDYVADLYDGLILNLANIDRADSTPEFVGEIDDLFEEIQRSRDEWKQTAAQQ